MQPFLDSINKGESLWKHISAVIDLLVCRTYVDLLSQFQRKVQIFTIPLGENMCQCVCVCVCVCVCFPTSQLWYAYRPGPSRLADYGLFPVLSGWSICPGPP